MGTLKIGYKEPLIHHVHAVWLDFFKSPFIKCLLCPGMALYIPYTVSHAVPSKTQGWACCFTGEKAKGPRGKYFPKISELERNPDLPAPKNTCSRITLRERGEFTCSRITLREGGEFTCSRITLRGGKLQRGKVRFIWAIREGLREEGGAPDLGLGRTH